MATTMGFKAFREAYLTADLLYNPNFTDYNARKVRYDILWAFYENTAYRNLHYWAQGYRNQYGLYSYIRNIYNPSSRLANLNVEMIWGGLLSATADDTGCIPIEYETGAGAGLDKAIVKLWADSNWSINKDIVTLQGSSMGDTGIKIIDDPDKKRVYLEVVHPSKIKSKEVDERGFVKAYALEETREDPDNVKKSCVYTETAEREEGTENVIFKTYKNGKPYAWGDSDLPEWIEPYGFIPFVFIQHNNVGQDWGWAEAHPARSKIHEADDLASKLHDQIRKTVDAPALIAGMTKPTSTPTTTRTQATTDRPEPGREEIPTLWASDPNAKYQPMVAPLDIAQSLATIQSILKELERDYPELRDDVWASNARVEGVQTARDRIEGKFIKRRASYDPALVRAHQMSIAIGGEKGYEGYKGFDLTSFAAGKLNHTIINRPVFNMTPDDKIALRSKEIALEMQELELAQMKKGMTKEEGAAVNA